MYKCLRKIRKRGKPAARSMNIMVNEFKEYFESVLRECRMYKRYEQKHGVIKRQ